MININEDLSARVLVFEIDGKLGHADYEKLVPQIEAWLAEHGHLRCLIDMAGFKGFEARALWDELRFDVRHAGDIERCAVLGDRRWEAWMTRLSNALFRSAEMRYFEERDREAALEWLRQEPYVRSPIR